MYIYIYTHTPMYSNLPPLMYTNLPPCANPISEAFRTDFVNKSMLLRSTTKPPIL